MVSTLTSKAVTLAVGSADGSRDRLFCRKQTKALSPPKTLAEEAAALGHTGAEAPPPPPPARRQTFRPHHHCPAAPVPVVCPLLFHGFHQASIKPLEFRNKARKDDASIANVKKRLRGPAGGPQQLNLDPDSTLPDRTRTIQPAEARWCCTFVRSNSLGSPLILYNPFSIKLAAAPVSHVTTVRASARPLSVTRIAMPHPSNHQPKVV